MAVLSANKRAASVSTDGPVQLLATELDHFLRRQIVPKPGKWTIAEVNDHIAAVVVEADWTFILASHQANALRCPECLLINASDFSFIHLRDPFRVTRMSSPAEPRRAVPVVLTSEPQSARAVWSKLLTSDRTVPQYGREIPGHRAIDRKAVLARADEHRAAHGEGRAVAPMSAVVVPFPVRQSH
jgi:hypothetical protein